MHIRPAANGRSPAGTAASATEASTNKNHAARAEHNAAQTDEYNMWLRKMKSVMSHACGYRIPHTSMQ
jgi:hypothetical protein